MSWRARHERMTASVLSGLCANPEVVPNFQAVRRADPSVLESLADYASLLADAALLRGSFVSRDEPPRPPPESVVTDADLRAGWESSVKAFQRRLILKAMEACNGRKQEVSKLLKMNPRTLYNKMHELGIMVYGPYQGQEAKGATP